MLILRNVNNYVTNSRVLVVNIGYSATLPSFAAFEYLKVEIARLGQGLDLHLSIRVKVRVFMLIKCNFQ